MQPSVGYSPRAQAWLSGTLTAVLVAAVAAVSVAADSERLIGWIESGRRAHWVSRNSLYVEKGCFVDLGSRVQLRDLPRADFSSGGVLFLGTSKVASFLKTWELPEELRPLVTDFSMGGLIPSHQLHFLRYLVEDEGLTAAGPGRVMVVLGLFWGDAGDPAGAGRPFVNVWRRYGLYSYDERGLRRRSHARAWNALLTRLGASTNLLRALGESVTVNGGRLEVRPMFPVRPDQDAEYFRDKWRAAMGADWETDMAEQVDALRATARYLAERGVEVHFVLLPDPSWFGELPYGGAYRQRVERVATEEGVRLHDMTHLLSDSEFADHAHANHSGARKTDAALMELALAFLQRTGALQP